MAEGIQVRLNRIRPPRVQITYDVENGDAIEKKELPFIVGVLADLAVMPAEPLPPLRERKFVEIDRDNFDQVMAASSPRLEISVPTMLPCASEKTNLKIEVVFSTIGELEPMSIVSKVSELSDQYDSLEHLHNLLTETEGSDAKRIVSDQITEIDSALNRQLNVIMHHESFKKIEATWRGLYYLVANSETNHHLKIRILNAPKADLLNDLKTEVEWDQSGLFNLVHEKEYGTYGGDHFSILIGDYAFGRTSDDIELLNKIVGIAAAAHAPFVTAADIDLYDVANAYEPRDFSDIFESSELTKWRAFRDSEDSRYMTLTLPRVLLRLPWGHENSAMNETFCFVEDAGNTPGNFLWGNSAFILAQRITNAFSLHGWTAAISGIEGGGLIESLPVHTFEFDDHEFPPNCTTESTISNCNEKELNDLGFMAICHCKDTGKAAFVGGQTINKPNLDNASCNARASATLPYILTASRFAHYIKVLLRDKVGTFLSKQSIEEYLNNWISSYVLLDDSATQKAKAMYPLRAARIVVTDTPGKPGVYSATVFLNPHFQLDELTSAIRLVVELPS
ncbi:MAG: type VI secretion system contractile sheath large subunit [SAR86 cluster bacterium]|uniref:Type VI secretion system contractile sheath large subunit n=1 Tax=SAR86 cluster bacterium TaxID=2030880 RepID=A0A2A4WZ77_9GAMM|nr:MAG: type VI secretion system contractile sheath large subunit [SAR86 cluster bacterium]